MTSQDIILLTAGMALVTYLPRVLPLWLLSSRTLPPVVIRWLELVPPAVLAAILAPALLLGKADGNVFIDFSLNNVFLLAAIPSTLVAWLTRSFFGTVATGMIAVALLRQMPW